jgi:Dyp-type peroxidase family
MAPVVTGKRGELERMLQKVDGQTIQLMRGWPVPDAIIPFDKLTTIHYARFVLLDPDETTGPAKTEPVLILSTNYDGPEGEDACTRSRALSHHVEELVRHAGDGLDQIFQCCQGYRKGQLASFLEENQTVASTFYVGASGRSRNQILWEAALRHEVDAILDENAVAWSKISPAEVRTRVRQRLAEDYPTIPSFPAQPDLTGKVRSFQAALAAVAFVVLAGAFWLAWRLEPVAVGGLWEHVVHAAEVVGITLVGLGAPILLLLGYFRHLEKTDPQFQPVNSKETHQHFAKVSVGENEFLQNQLTHLAYVKPGLLRWLLIRGVFFALQVLSTNQYNKGKLGDIPSIHFARWVLLPHRAVLFFSNFDSSWQSYLGDFIDKASSGLTAVWSNTVGYPRTTWLLSAGSRDAGRFLAWTRAGQRPTQVWYCAYPGLSIVNVNDNTELRRGLAEDSIPADTWLFLLRGVEQRAVDGLYSEERARDAPLARKDIQGLILKGYGFKEEARYLLFRVSPTADLPALRKWLSQLELTSAAEGSRMSPPSGPLLNVAFTYQGLRALDLDEQLCSSFSTPFVQGSDDAYRARVNGDLGESAPERWRWGSGDKTPHLMLAVFDDKAKIEDGAKRYRLEAEGVGLELLLDEGLKGGTLPGRKEHFGFRDGIAQPVVRGSGRAEMEANTVDAGEFLLGHIDGYGNVTDSPVSSSGFAFGFNGSYLVFRQLKQDVEEFWRYCAADRSKQPAVVAAKMVGRWPSGASLVRHPDEDPDDPRFADEDNFGYLATSAENDRYGARCPFGSHVRRSNPRDWQLGMNPEESMGLSNLHRIIRRGRPYGPPIAETMKPDEILQNVISLTGAAADEERGMQFICFNANIDRQFEFVQQQWCNNPKFAGLVSDADPLLGPTRPHRELGLRQHSFTSQTDVRKELDPRCTEMKRFVSVVGSAYFFMPSLPAVRLLGGEHLNAPRGTALLEKVPPDEQIHINSLISTLRDKMKRDYASRRTLRDAHPKMHGCVKATLTIEPNLGEELGVGLFNEVQEYQAWVRFSNADGAVNKDDRRDIRGVAIKVLDVLGPKLLDGEEDSTTQDFLLISRDTFFARDVAEFDGFIQALDEGRVPGYLLRHPGFALRLLPALQKHGSPLEIPYFSAVPYLLGARAVKYHLRPSSPERTPIPKAPPRDYLRDAMRTRLTPGSAPVLFDFMVQVQTNEEDMPVEDPTVSWPENRSHFVKVATLEIPAQSFDEENRELGENLSFNPWRCLPQHRPLGGMNRARRQVYRALSSFRHLRNATDDDFDRPRPAALETQEPLRRMPDAAE